MHDERDHRRCATHKDRLKKKEEEEATTTNESFSIIVVQRSKQLEDFLMI